MNTRILSHSTGLKMLLALWVCLLAILPLDPASAGDQDQELIRAGMKGEIEKVTSLLDGGADVNARDQRLWTPLMWAISRGQTDLVKLLLDRDADVNARAERGWTALMEAANRGNPETVKLLLDKGADTRVKHEYGWTALSIAQGKGKKDVEALLRARAKSQ